MRALVWIVEDTWKATVTAAGTLLPGEAEITLLHVRAREPEAVARGALHGLLGRPHPRPAASVQAVLEEGEQQLLADAQALLGHNARVETRSGRVEHEVVAAAQDMDVLLMARDGARTHAGAHSLGPTARFVVDHAPSAILLIWPD